MGIPTALSSSVLILLDCGGWLANLFLYMILHFHLKMMNKSLSKIKTFPCVMLHYLQPSNALKNSNSLIFLRSNSRTGTNKSPFTLAAALRRLTTGSVVNVLNSRIIIMCRSIFDVCSGRGESGIYMLIASQLVCYTLY